MAPTNVFSPPCGHCGLPFVAAAALAAVALAGCEPPPLDYREVKRIDEPIAPAEYQAFVRIVESLPGQCVPDLPVLYAPPPDWSKIRTLPVSELVHEELAGLDDRWSIAGLAELLARNRPLQRSVARERMNVEQFVGLTVSLGAALSRSQLGDSQDPKKLRSRGDLELERLQSDHRSFASLSDEARHAVLQRAVWITRRDRAERLDLVPAENLALARRHRDWLSQALPREFSRNPFDDIIDWLDERGVPFEELPTTGSDAELEWSRDAALIGRDAPGPPPRPDGMP